MNFVQHKICAVLPDGTFFVVDQSICYKTSEWSKKKKKSHLRKPTTMHFVWVNAWWFGAGCIYFFMLQWNQTHTGFHVHSPRRPKSNLSFLRIKTCVRQYAASETRSGVGIGNLGKICWLARPVYLCASPGHHGQQPNFLFFFSLGRARFCRTLNTFQRMTAGQC